MPETQAQFAVEVPHVEEKYHAEIQLDAAMRRESTLADLDAQIKTAQETAASLRGGAPATDDGVFGGLSNSRTAKDRQVKMRRTVQELRRLTRKEGDEWVGPCAPATIINLNPVSLFLTGQLQRWNMPAAGKGKSVKIGFNGRTFEGSYITVSTPETWFAQTGVQSDPVYDTPSVRVDHLSPIGIAHQFYSHYSIGATDAQGMGGILIFEGDIHCIEDAFLAKSKGRVRVPRAVPQLDMQAQQTFTLEAVMLREYLAEELTRQRTYADLMISKAHSFHISNSDDIRNQIHDGHRAWHNYALEKGYIDAALPWATKALTDSPLIAVVRCGYCKTRQEEDGQHFCRSCNAPFDAHKTFMAGFPVAKSYLAAYSEESKEWKEIIVEMGRRKRRMELLGGDDEEVSVPKGKGK